jgi:3-methyladenine DNA glycosylase AlkC
MSRNINGVGFSLKDHLFNKHKVTYLGSLLKEADESFDQIGFESFVNSKLTKLELKSRIGHIASGLEKYLVKDFTKATKHILRSLPAPLDPSAADNDFGDFIFAPFGEFVVRRGLSLPTLDISLNTLRELTMRFSMEDAIRHFINAYPDKTLEILHTWSKDKNYHVRRLVSEGTRALLPWSCRLNIDPLLPLVYLNELHADQTRYVTRSVANHLNDISKIYPDQTIKTLKAWHKARKQNDLELAWMTRHSLRTLAKQGHKDALLLLGYEADFKIKVSKPILIKNEIRLGESLDFSFDLSADKAIDLLIDYKIAFMKANGSRSSKVYRVKKIYLQKGEKISLKKTHLFKKNSSTFKYYSGFHSLTLQINGQTFGTVDFQLLI